MTPVTNFQSWIIGTQQAFMPEHVQETIQKTQLLRVIAVASAIITGISGAFFTSLALTTAAASYGFSTVLLAPAAVLFLVSFESYKVMRCCDIIMERAQTGPLGETVNATIDAGATLLSGYPLWAQKVKREVDQTILLSWFINQPCKNRAIMQQQ